MPFGTRGAHIDQILSKRDSELRERPLIATEVSPLFGPEGRLGSFLQRQVALPEPDDADDNIQAEMAAAGEYYAEPLGFVRWAFPWGKGTLANFRGPDDWQRDFLEQLGQEVKARGF